MPKFKKNDVVHLIDDPAQIAQIEKVRKDEYVYDFEGKSYIYTIKDFDKEYELHEGVENWNCSVCCCELTHLKGTEGDYDEIDSDTHFDIVRSRKFLYIDDGEIVEDTKKSNQKMRKTLCEDCFVKILNESKTLGSLFLNKEGNKFIY